MYNIEYNCKYHEVAEDDESNKQFRADLLAVFNLDDEGDLVEKIEEVYEHLECESLIELLRNHSLAMLCDSDTMLFLLLFNYDYFHSTHKCIREYLTTKRQGTCYAELENLLRKTIQSNRLNHDA